MTLATKLSKQKKNVLGNALKNLCLLLLSSPLEGRLLE